MSWNERTQIFIEDNVFKGKIIDRRSGRHGLVYIVERDTYPPLVAYKTIKKIEDEDITQKPIDNEHIDREAKNWFLFAGHPLVINPYFVKDWNGIPLICMPYCDGDLRDLLNIYSQELNLTSAVCLSFQIVKGMMIANSRGMDHHQDMKPENLVYTDLNKKFSNFPPTDVDRSVKYSIRVADFGVANAIHDNHLGGTNAYKAPEQFNNKSYNTFAPDIFAVGIIMAELFQGFHPAVDEKSKSQGVCGWRGDKLKKWTLKGKRHFANTEDPQGSALVKLIKQMLNPCPEKRPSFQECYKQLADILKALSPATLEYLEVLFHYFDNLANFYGLEEKIANLLCLAQIRSNREYVLANIKKCFKDTLEKGSSSLKKTLELHHLSKALHKIYGDLNKLKDEDKKLLVDAYKEVIRFVLEHHESITADCLWPTDPFDGLKLKNPASDIEAKAEIFNTSFERVQQLKENDEHLEKQVKEGGDAILALRVLGEASKAWQAGKVEKACELLKEVCQLSPYDPGLKRLYNIWTNTRDFYRKIHVK